MYDVMSSKAEEFISDEEIRDCLDYAKKNKTMLYVGIRDNQDRYRSLRAGKYYCPENNRESAQV